MSEVSHARRPAGEEMIDLASLLRPLWAGRRWVAAGALGGLLLGAVYAWLLATPLYRASAVVMLESREAQVFGFDSVLSGLSTASTPVVRTETEVLRGRRLMGRVVDDLNLIADPEFNISLRAPGLMDRLRALVSEAPAAQDETSRARAERDATVSELLDQVDVVNVSGSLVFTISAESTSADKAAAIADTIARAYIEDQLRVRFEATEAAATWLTGQLAELRASLENAETEMRRFQSETNLVDADALAALERQLKELRNRRAQVEGQLVSLRDRIAALETTEDPALRLRLAADDVLTALAAGDLTDPLLRSRFDDRLATISQQLAQDLARLESQVLSLDQAAQSLADDIARQSQDLIRLDQLAREADANRLLYEHFQTRLKETSAQLGIRQADSRILSEAVIPRLPAAPGKKMILVLAAVLGLVLGAGLVLMREVFSRSLRNWADLETLTGRPVLAQIPEIPGKTRRDTLSWLATNPTSAPAESVRNLRTSLLLATGGVAPQVVVLTSSVPGEGKTTLTASLAQNLTAMGKRVLVIEGDVRSCAISRHLAGDETARPDAKGLVEVLLGTATLEEAIHKTGIRGDLLPCIAATASAIDLFASEAFTRLIAAARTRYDMVLLDTPPVLAVPDARVIAQAADATLFLVRWDKTSRDQVREALSQLEMVNIGVTGLILSHVSPKGMKRYGYDTIYGSYAEVK